MLSIHEVEDQPQVISTNRHLMQGYVDVYRTLWNSGKKELSGVSSVVGGETYKVVLATNGYLPVSCTASGASCRIETLGAQKDVIVLIIDRPQNGLVSWSVSFSKVDSGVKAVSR
jgi:hypothetical protein